MTEAFGFLNAGPNAKLGVILGLYWGYFGILENRMETTIEGLGFRVMAFWLASSNLGFSVSGSGLVF